MTSPQAPLPTFLIIGAQKSATRWLRTNLGLHPEIYAAPAEPSFFNANRYVELGLPWYREQFEGWDGEAIVGEATPGYMMWRHKPRVVAKRIHETVPDVRLIAILRNPIDRTQSALRHHIKHGRIEKDADLLEVVTGIRPRKDRMGLIAGGWYAASLKPFRRRFGDQLLVLFHDDIRRDPRAVYAQALAHVGASPGFVAPDIDEVLFSNEPKNEAKRRALTPEERRVLWPYFRSDVRKLQRMTGRDLSSWNPRIAERAPEGGRVP